MNGCSPPYGFQSRIAVGLPAVPGLDKAEGLNSSAVPMGPATTPP